MKFFFMLTLSFGMTTFLFVGCSTYSKSECQQMDWFQVGQKFAMDGRTLQNSQDHFAKACVQEHDVAVDQEKLKLGFDSGLKVFCSESYSYEFAKSGGTYMGTCPKTIEDKMLPNLKNGRIVFLENKVVDLENQVSSLTSQLSSAQSELSFCRSQVKQ